MMKLVSWNVNGIRACVNKGFYEFFQAIDADIFCIQETKMQPGQLELNTPGYHQFMNSADKKGYSGTLIFTKQEPLETVYGIGIDEHDHEGRVITCEFEKFFMVNVYTPSSKEPLARLTYRMKWEDDFQAYLKKLEVRKPVIVCGDMNVAVEEIDIKNPKSNHNNPGFSDEERDKMRNLLHAGFVDSFRYLHPETIAYSWWSYRFKAREKNIGWRIDYFLTSQALKEQIRAASIHSDVLGSDHCPVSLEIDL